MKPQYAVLDVETTGLDPNEHRVVEIAIVHLDAHFNVLDVWSTIVDPGCDIPRDAVAIHGIGVETLTESTAPTFADISDEVTARLANCMIVGHHVEFDLGFIQAEYERCDKPARRMTGYDTCNRARNTIPGQESYKLSSLLNYIESQTVDTTSFVGDHCAERDALGAAELFKYLELVVVPRNSRNKRRTEKALKAANVDVDAETPANNTTDETVGEVNPPSAEIRVVHDGPVAYETDVERERATLKSAKGAPAPTASRWSRPVDGEPQAILERATLPEEPSSRSRALETEIAAKLAENEEPVDALAAPPQSDAWVHTLFALGTLLGLAVFIIPGIIVAVYWYRWAKTRRDIPGEVIDETSELPENKTPEALDTEPAPKPVDEVHRKIDLRSYEEKSLKSNDH